MLRRLTLALLGSVCLSTASHAGDVFDRDVGSMKDFYEAPYIWTGFYIGAQGGWAWGEADSDFDNDAPGVSLDGDSHVIGGHLGYNFQSGNWVFGIEGDIENTDLDSSDDSGAIIGFDSHASFSIDWLASIRGRLGYAFDRSLIYVTGGAAFTDIDFEGGPVGGPINSNSESVTGWTIGAGWEYALGRGLTGSNELTARIEYRFISFEDASGDLAPDFPDVDQDIDLDIHAIRVGLTYKFPPRYEAQPLK